MPSSYVVWDLISRGMEKLRALHGKENITCTIGSSACPYPNRHVNETLVVVYFNPEKCKPIEIPTEWYSFPTEDTVAIRFIGDIKKVEEINRPAGVPSGKAPVEEVVECKTDTQSKRKRSGKPKP